MSRHRVDLARLLDIVDQMARFDARMETELEDVDRRVTRLHAEWTGHAAEEHRAAHQRWRQGAAEMRRALLTMREIANTAHGNYDSATAANIRMWDL